MFEVFKFVKSILKFIFVFFNNLICFQKIHSLAQQSEPKLSMDADVCNALIDYLDEFVGEVSYSFHFIYLFLGYIFCD